MKKLRPKGVPVGLIIGLIVLVGCAQTVKTDVGKSETSKLVKSCLDVFFQMLEETKQGDEHYMHACDAYARAKTREEKNTALRLLTQTKQYYNTAEQTLRKIPLQENEQIDEICSLLLQSIRLSIGSVSYVHDYASRIFTHPPVPEYLREDLIRDLREKWKIPKRAKQSADTKLIKAWNKIRELMGDKEESEEQYLPPNIVEHIDILKKISGPSRLKLIEPK